MSGWCPRKCFGAEVQSIGYQHELGLTISRAGRWYDKKQMVTGSLYLAGDVLAVNGTPPS